MPGSDKWSQYEVGGTAASASAVSKPTASKPDKWARYEAAPARAAVSATLPPPDYSRTISSLTPPPEGFLASALSPLKSAALGLWNSATQGPQNEQEARFVGEGRGESPDWDAGLFRQPLLLAKRVLVDPQVEQARQAQAAFAQAAPLSLRPTNRELEQRQLAGGHALAAILPGVGPWAAQVGAKEGQQLGTGDYSGAVGTLLGNAALALAPKAAGKVGEVAVRAPESLARAATDTGAGPVRRLVRETQAANKEVDAENANRLEKQRQDQAAAREGNPAYLKKEMAARKAEAQATAAAAQRQVLARGQQTYAERAMANAKQTFQTVKSRLDSRFNSLRQALGDKPLDSAPIQAAVEQAKQKYLMGAPESLKQFNDLTRTISGQSSPELVLADQTAQNLGYKDFRQAVANPATRSLLERALPPDVWQAATSGGAGPLSWQEGRVHYSALGDRLYSGELPGNVRQAVGLVRDALDDQLSTAAKANKLDKFYRSTQDAWSQFKQDWDNMGNLSYSKSAMGEAGSPLARLVRAADPASAARALSNDQIVGQLAKYSDHGAKPQLAAGFRELGKRAEAIEKAPAARHPAKSGYVPPESIQADLQPRRTISSPDLAAARRAAAEARAEKFQTRGTWVSTWPVFQAMRAIWGGHIPSLPGMALESAGTYATVRAASALMRYPPLLRFLTEARPADLALVPPDLRGDLPGLVNLAWHEGVKVSPALTAAAAAVAGGAMVADRPANRQSSIPVITPAQAISAMQPAAAWPAPPAPPATPAGGPQ